MQQIFVMPKLHVLVYNIILLNLLIGSVWCAAAPAAEALAAAAAAAAAKPTAQFQEYELPPTGSELPAGLYDTSAVAIDGLVGYAADEEFSANSEPSGFTVTPCSLSDPNKDECIRQLIQTIAPKLKYNGLQEYGLGSIDPYFYRRGIFRYANDGIQGGLLIKNMNIHGISTIKVNSVLSNFTAKGFIVKLNVEIPKLQADGQFKADVKFGGLRLVPKGPFNITIDNVRATILTDGIIEDTAVGQRLSLHRLNANVAVGETRIIANGIFSDRNLNTMILNLVNENLPEITRVGIPATREQWAPILVTHINEFFANVPIDKFLVQ